MTRMFRNIFMFFIVMMSLLGPGTVSAQTGQGTQNEAFGMTVTDSQIDEWLGRERRLNHPVVKGLETKDAATLHFYFSREYGQRAEYVIATAESARSKTLRFLPQETVEDIHVYLLGNINEYFTGQGSTGHAPDWAAGLTLLHDGVILIRLAPRGTGRVEPERTLAHELNHAALRRFAKDNYFPHWFYEGLAMLATDDWSPERSDTLGRAAMTGQLLSLDEINPAFAKTGAPVDLAYAQSVHFMTWLDRTYGDEAIRNLIRKVAEGTPFDNAFIEVFGRSPKAAHAIWKDSMSRGKNILASIFSKDGVFFFISVFAAFGLCFALWRKSAARRRRKENMNQSIPKSALPENLRNFGPFTSTPKRKKKK